MSVYAQAKAKTTGGNGVRIKYMRDEPFYACVVPDTRLAERDANGDPILTLDSLAVSVLSTGPKYGTNERFVMMLLPLDPGDTPLDPAWEGDFSASDDETKTRAEALGAERAIQPMELKKSQFTGRGKSNFLDASDQYMQDTVTDENPDGEDPATIVNMETGVIERLGAVFEFTKDKTSKPVTYSVRIVDQKKYTALRDKTLRVGMVVLPPAETLAELGASYQAFLDKRAEGQTSDAVENDGSDFM